MSKRFKRIVSVITVAIVASAAIGYSVLNDNEQVVSADNTEVKEEINEAINDNIKFTSTGEDKEETVYVLSDANGNVKKTIVSDWLKNKDGSDTITDKSDLHNIENVKSDADYTNGKDGEIIWAADGEDIYYQGETNKELPVDVKITYLIDGKEVSASEMAGKSGKVTIRFDYINNQKKEVTVNGKKTEMYVPFTMISGMILDGDKFSNVEVNSGKVISDGSKYVVVGLAFPGMNDNLDLNNLLKDTDMKERFPETFEITADVEDFELALTITMGSADLLSQVNVDDMRTLDELKDKLDELVSATNQLKSGTGQIKDGLSELNGKFGEYSQGVGKLVGGVNEINDGVGQLNNKTGEFADGLGQVLNGIDTIISKLEGDNGAIAGSKNLASGANQVHDGVAELQNKSGQLIDGIGRLESGAKMVDDNMKLIISGFADKSQTEPGLITGSRAVADGVAQLQQQLTGMVATINQSVSDNNAQIEQITQLLAYGKNPDTGDNLSAEEIAGYNAALQQLQGANVALQQVLKGMNPEAMSSSLTTLSNGAKNVADGVATVDSGLKKLQNEGTSQVAAGAGQLNDSVPALADGISKLEDGSAQIAQGATALSEGIVTLHGAVISELRPGVDKLYQGGLLLRTSVNKLYEGTQTASDGGKDLLTATSQVSDGISKLSEGAITLDNGMSQFKSEVTDKLDGEVKNTLTEVSERIKSVVNIANDYTIYTDAAEGKSTSVKFIYETDGIKK